MRLSVITPPEALVSAPDAKLWAPVFGGDDDARVAALLQAAQAAIEPPNGWAGRAFGMQTLEAYFDGFRCGRLCLPCPPLREVTEVAFLDRDGVEVVLGPSDYRVLGIGTAAGMVVAGTEKAWPAQTCERESVRVRFRAGYEADDPQLGPVKQAIVFSATHLRSLGSQDLALRSEEVDGVGTITWTVSDAARALVQGTVESLLSPYRVMSL